MKPRFFFPALGLVAVLVAVSCAPAVTSPPAAPISSPLGTAEVVIPATAAPADTSAPEATAAVPAPTQTVEVEVQAVPTSRGPNLEATDPATVSLASGQLQLIEFFRFT